MRVQRAKVGGKSLDYFEADHWQLAIGNWQLATGMDMAVKSPSPSAHNPLLGLHNPMTSPHNPLGIQLGGKGAMTGLPPNPSSNADEGTEVARQVSNLTLTISLIRGRLRYDNIGFL